MGGGEAATLEPLSQHLDAYSAHLAQNFGAGVQACYRGNRWYDTDDTKAVVVKWIDFFKQYRDILIEAYENAGFGGFWFGDVNQIIERMSGQQYGLRPLVGAKNRFGGDVSVADRIDLLGPGPSTVFDVSRAFWDPDLTATNRAQLIRRIVPYNNVLWWAGISRNLAQTTGEAFE